MNKLSNTSRIFLAIASLSLIAVYFFPIWRIDLFAPQYPEGLMMNIWLNDIKGQVDIVNGLNHYIGMRKINVDMFPEFQFLVYIVAFYIILGLSIAVIGNRKLLFWYLVFTMFGGAFAMYDFYRWGYEYGHNLDPTAPIKVPGLSYQPPLFGHKRMLNFDAYSFPDVGGWIVITAAGIAFLVWFYEWYRNHKKKNQTTTGMKSATGIAAIITAVSFSSCSAQPEPFNYGTDVCHTCKMGVADIKFGNEIITKKGKVYKFDDIGCMVRYLKSGVIEQKEIAQTVVINYEKKGDFIDVNNAAFAVSQEIRSPMNFNTAAFTNKEVATKFLAGKNGKILTWNEIYNKIE
jgi:copper chaperone NosL